MADVDRLPFLTTTLAAANQAFQDGEFAEALALFDRVIAVEPRQPFHLNARGVCRAQLGQFDRAEADLLAALALNDQVAVFHFNLGQIYQAQDRLLESLDHQRLYKQLVDRTCPYYPDRLRDRTEVVPLSPPPTPEEFDFYLAQGYRRKVDDFARNICSQCQACVQNRILVDQFQPSHSQKRLLRRTGRMLTVAPSEASQFTAEKGQLYTHYLKNRHRWPGGDYSHIARSLHQAWPGAMELTYWLEGRLVAVGVFDVGQTSLYASEFYCHEDALRFSPGIFNILSLITYAQRTGRRYLYMGEYINGLPGMMYKKAFSPQEILVGETWRLRTAED